MSLAQASRHPPKERANRSHSRGTPDSAVPSTRSLSGRMTHGGVLGALHGMMNHGPELHLEAAHGREAIPGKQEAIGRRITCLHSPNERFALYRVSDHMLVISLLF